MIINKTLYKQQELKFVGPASELKYSLSLIKLNELGTFILGINFLECGNPHITFLKIQSDSNIPTGSFKFPYENSAANGQWRKQFSQQPVTLTVSNHH